MWLQETVFQSQAEQLAAAVPELFAPGCSIRLATENGRSLLAKAGFTASRCQPVGRTSSRGAWRMGMRLAGLHAGALTASDWQAPLAGTLISWQVVAAAQRV